MIEVQLDSEVLYSGDSDSGLSEVVAAMLSVMNGIGWASVVVKVSPGFTLDTTHRQIIVDGCRYSSAAIQSGVMCQAFDAVEALMEARKLKFFAVREVSQSQDGTISD